MEIAEVAAPAKLNLTLRVGPASADGFHPLRTWMVTVGLRDRLLFSPAATDLSQADASEKVPGPRPAEVHQAGDLRFRLTCNEPSLPLDETNLVVKAAKGFMEEARRSGMTPQQVDAAARGLEIALEKHIPAGGGLGGGSSDAAATLVGLSLQLGLVLPEARKQRLAASLGSDVPFFWAHLRHHLSHTSDARVRSAECTGRGEVVEPTAEPRPAAALLLLPALACPTGQVYRHFDTLFPDGGDLTGPSPADLADLHAEAMLPHLVNHLQPAAFDLFPQLARLADSARERLGRPVLLSGSGSTLFTLFDEMGEAESAGKLLGNHPAAKNVAPFRAVAVTLPD